MTVKRVSPVEADRLVREDGYVYLDVRSVPEFEVAHPAGAYNVPYLHATASGMQPNPDFMAVVESFFSKDSKLVVGCRSGNRSLAAARALLQAGFTQVVDQRAGLDGTRNAFGQVLEPGWESEGLEIATEPEPYKTYAALLARARR
ncbi:MAG TPA: rhodanese-like domain-containing protein [Polyangiales bacterium]|nr:rhodanese-like domain-containing protein [Polyangiales bacterium]